MKLVAAKSISVMLSIMIGPLALASCAAEENEPRGFAASENARVRFFLSESMARDSFDNFCRARTNLAAHLRCATFEDYRITVNVDSNRVTLIFAHEHIESESLGSLPSFACTYWQDAANCWTDGE